MPSPGDRPLVLIVDDEADVADTYALRLEPDYETRVAYSGREALEQIDDDVDAVLLDRRMPDLPGDDVLERFRERGYDCPVIMATAVDPDLNILEMDFDDYLCKPIFQDTLRSTLDQHLDREVGKDEELEEFLSLISKLDVLEEELTHAELVESERYQDLKRRADDLGRQLRDRVEDFDDIVSTYREIDRKT